MPPTLILIRHAEAMHNQTHTSQCKELREALLRTLPGKLEAGLILASPMKRTVQTTLLSLDWLIEKGVPVHAHAGWQETTNHNCDVGSPIASLQKEFPTVDFSHVDPVFPDKTSPRGSFYEWSRKALLNRAQAVLKELYDRPEKVVLVVTHSGFLTKAVTGCAFSNADYRIFDFEERKEVEQPYRLIEWGQTREGHGGMGCSLDVIWTLGEGIPEVAPPADG